MWWRRNLPTNKTSLSAGALLGGGRSTLNSRMPETTGLTKYMSKIEKMYIRWKTMAKARNRKRGKRAMVGARREASDDRW